MLAHVLDSAVAAGLDEVVLVLGHEADAHPDGRRRRLDGVRVVVNPDYAARPEHLAAGRVCRASRPDARRRCSSSSATNPQVGPEVI